MLMRICLSLTPGPAPSNAQQRLSGSGKASASGWTVDRCELDAGMQRVEWDSVQAVCVPRAPVVTDRLVACLRHVIDTPSRFDDLADLLELVILVARHEAAVYLYSSVALNRCLFIAPDEGLFTLTDRLGALSDSGTKLSLNEKALPEFLTYRFITPPATLLKGVFKLPPGQMMRIDLNKGVITEQSSIVSWQIPSVDASRAPQDLDLVLQSEMLTSSATDHPRVLLSGGMDSTLLASILRARHNTVPSYSSGFEQIDPANRERAYAESAAQSVGTRHRHIVLSSQQFLSAIVDATAANEEPIHHLQSAALLHLFASISGGSHNDGPLYCGEAADGLFGNDMHGLLSRRLLLLRAMTIPGARTAARWARQRSIIPRRLSYLDFDISVPAESPDHLLWSYGRYVPAERLTALCSFEPEDIIAGRRKLVKSFPERELLDHVTLLSFFTEGFATMSIWSRIASSQGLKMAYPFASPGCLKLALGMPWAYKLRSRKAPINDLLISYGVPSSIRERPKQSFGLNSAYWAPKQGLMQPLIDCVCTTYDPSILARLQQGDGSDVMLLWNIIALEIWSKLVLEGVSPEDLKASMSDASDRAFGAGEPRH